VRAADERSRPPQRNDDTMGRPKSPYGRTRCRTNAVKHGVLSKRLLLSRGPEDCPFAANCHVVKDPELAPACVPGRECVVEKADYLAFVDSAKDTFSPWRHGHSDLEYEDLIRRLALLSLQRHRLAALIAKDGFTRRKISPAGVEYGLRETLGAGRYSASIDNQYRTLLERLMDERAATA